VGSVKDAGTRTSGGSVCFDFKPKIHFTITEWEIGRVGELFSSNHV
jgi:hypothetical protein